MKEIFSTKYIFIALFILLAALCSIPGIGYFRYVYLFAGVIVIFLFRREIVSILKDNKQLLIYYPFAGWALLTAVWSYNPEVSLQRGIYLLFIISAGIFSGSLWYKKFFNLNFLLPVNLVAVILSFLSLISGFPSGNWLLIDVLAFRGFMTHPNTLASLIMFSFFPVLVLLFRIIGNKNENSNADFGMLKIILLIFIVIINLLLLAVTFSRAAVLSVLLFVNLVMLTYHIKYLILTYFVLLLLVLISLFLLPDIPKYIYKQYIVKGTDSIMASRYKLIEDSYLAAKNGGIKGLGYGVSDSTIKNPVYSNPGTGVREKGNSFLALIEETGWIGLFLFIFPVIYPVYYGVRKKIKFTQEIMTILFILISLFVHAQFEGWLTGVAFFSLLYYFLFFGSLLRSLSLQSHINKT
jgi:O-antigen ligase